MSAIRLSCVALLAGLLVAMPALPAPADEVKKNPTDKKASPQPIQKQQASSQPGANLNQPGQCDTRSGAAAQNPACKTPKGNDAFGGGHGPGAAGAQLAKEKGSAIKDPPQAESKLPTGQTPAQKAAANNKVPGADGKLVQPGDFSREAKLKNLTDPNSALGEGMKPLSGPGSATTSPGQTSGADLVKNAGAIPGPGSGKNTVSKQDQQGVMTETQLNILRAKGADWQREGKTNGYEGHTYVLSGGADSAVTTTRVQFDANGNQRELTTLKADKVTTIKYDAKGNVVGNTDKKTPNPETDTGGGHGMKNMVGTDQVKKTPAQIEAERKRQVTQPNETGTKPDRMRAENAAQQTMSGRQGNLINPERGDGTTAGGFTGSPKSGVQKSENKGGVKPGCPPDNPAC